MMSESLKVNEETSTTTNERRKLTKKERKTLRNALKNGKDEIARNLINIADSLETKIEGRTPILIVACIANRFEIVKYLLSLGANINVVDGSNSTALMNMELQFGSHFEMFKYLIDFGADINFETVSGTVLSYASNSGNIECVKFLISLGVDLDKCGKLALIETAFSGHVEVVKLLLDSGVDVNSIVSNVYYNSTSTALHRACLNNKFEMVQLLMDSGADETIENSNGKTPIELTKNEEIKEFIINYNSTKYVLK